MNEKINHTNNSNETQQFESELTKWREYQRVGEHLNDPEMIGNGVIRQVEYLYYLDRVDEARTFLDALPESIDIDEPKMREMLTDAYVMVNDVEYFYSWYKKNLFNRGANEGDQILIYALLCRNRNSEALEVFDKIFPALTTSNHFTQALRHIPKIIAEQNQRTPYYQSILERSQSVIANSGEQSAQAEWYEISLQAHYSLDDTSGFEKTAHAMAMVDPEAAQTHLVFLKRLLDIDNPKWKENKVFGIGLSKTGTSSLSKALTLLDFSTAHWTNPYGHDLLTKEDIPLFDSLTDISISHQYREIYEEYPDAKFILSGRSIEKWEKSFLTHYARAMSSSSFEDLKRIITEQKPPRFGQRYVDIHQELYFQYPDLAEAYRAHERGVLEFFEGREDQLLLLDVSQPNALQNLSAFLEVDCQQNDFPHTNTKEEKSSWVSPISGVTRTFKDRS